MSAIPRVLESALEFGNLGQIQALRGWEKKIDEALLRKENEKRYLVTLSFSGEFSVEVNALDEGEAFDLASEQSVTNDLCDLVDDFDLVSCQELKDRG